MTAVKRPGRKATLRAAAAGLEAAERRELKRIIGDLSNQERTLVGMELVPGL